MSKIINIKLRYYCRHTEPIEAQQEKNCHYNTVDWQIPLDNIALICLDIWNLDVHQDMQERDNRITRERIVPLVAACRKSGLQLIHAPAPPIARRHPNWVDLVQDKPHPTEYPDSPEWPPREFKNKTGEYTQYAFPEESIKLKSWEYLEGADFHDLVKPEKDEPVIATGEELHRLCAQKGILFLLFAGHHTPGCMTGRTYGMVKMQGKGYTCILVRDCTNGMETHETHDEQISMKGTIAFLEQTGLYTLLSDEIIKPLKGVKDV